MAFWKNNKQFVILLVIVGFLIYFNSLFNGFVWDDEEQIINNTVIKSVANIPSLFSKSLFDTDTTGDKQATGSYYRPIMPICYTIIYSLFGLNPFFFRLFQVLLHIINAVLIFFFFSSIFKSRTKKAVPLILSLAFLVHPINSEAVLFAGIELLFVFFGMIGLNLLIKNINIKALGLTMILFFLALLTKETGLVFLIIGFFYICLFHKKSISLYLILSSFFISFYLILRLAVANVGFIIKPVFPIATVDLKTRLLTLPKIIFFYIKTFVFPLNLAISQHWLVRSLTLADVYIPLIASILFFIILIKIVKSQNNKIGVFFLLWFILGLIPHLQLIPLNMTVAERWFYLPMIGLLGMLGGFGRLRKINFITIIIVIIIIVALAGRTIIRTFNWRNGLSLYSHDIKISRDSFDLDNNLGVELFRLGKVERAKVYFERSTKIAPHWWTNWNNLGVYYQNKGNLETAKKYYRKSIDNGQYYLAYENYALVLFQEKKYDELKTFLEKEALMRFPNNVVLKKLYDYLLK